MPWRDLPERYGNWKTVHGRHRRWSLDGTCEQVLDALFSMYTWRRTRLGTFIGIQIKHMGFPRRVLWGVRREFA